MISPLWIGLVMAFAPVPADWEVVTRTACTSLEGKTIGEAKQELLLAARRYAAGELLGSLITSVTRVENLKLEKDRIQEASAGYLYLAGEPEFFNGQGLGELCVTIKAYTLDEDRAAIELALRALLDGQGPPKFVLDTDLSRLGLGSRAVLAVAAIPPQALEGARCDWTIEPADVLRTTKPDGTCRLEVAMPDAPLAGRVSTLPARIAVRIRRGDQVLDELTVRGMVHNGLAIEPVVGASALAQGTSVQVKVVPRGRQDPIPPGFTCSWSIGSVPLVFTPSTDNGCQGRLELKPEDTWSQLEGISYTSVLLEQAPLSVAVRLLHDGGLVNEGTTEVKLTVTDSRDPQRLFWRFSRHRPRGGIVGVDDMLSEMGLPPASSLNEENLELHLAFERGLWTLMTYYNSGRPEAALVPLDRQTSLLRVLYSLDGKSFEQGLIDYVRSAKELAGTTQIWVQIEPVIGGEAAGPFRLSLDFPIAARAALTEAWHAMDKEDRQRFACSGLVVGSGSFFGDLHHEFIAILDEVSVGRGEGALWRTQRYNARLEYLFEKEFKRVPPPVGPTDYVSRLLFASGQEEVFTCPLEGYSPFRKTGLRYYLLKRTAARATSMPEEIEVSLSYESLVGWTVTFGDGLEPAFVRVSSGGTGFRTVEQPSADHRRVTFSEAEGNQLILRFVMASGEEVEYRGRVDYSAHRFATIRDTLFTESKLTCAAYDPEHAGEKEMDRWPRGMDGPAVVCGFAIGGGEYIPVASSLLVLRSVDYGCARDKLTFADRFEEERALGPQGKWEELTFALPGHCDTVYARFNLSDGSRSEVLAAPVVSSP